MATIYTSLAVSVASGGTVAALYGTNVLGDYGEGVQGMEFRNNDEGEAIWKVPHWFDTGQANHVPQGNTGWTTVVDGEGGGSFTIKCDGFDEGIVSTSIPVWPVRDASDLVNIIEVISTSDATGNKSVSLSDAPKNSDMNSTARKRIGLALGAVGRSNSRGAGVSSKVFDPDGHIETYYNAYLVAYMNAAVMQLETQILKDKVEEAQEMAVLQADVYYDEYNLYLGGYLFFDYEKALNTVSALSDFMSVEKVENWFGRELTHTFFTLHESSINKGYDKDMEESTDMTPSEAIDARTGILPNEATWMGGITTTYHSTTSVANVSGSLIQERPGITANDYAGSMLAAQTTQKSFDEIDAEIVTSQFVARSFRFTDADAPHDYRLMAFEIVDSAGPYEAATPPEQEGSGCIDTNDFQYGDDYLYTGWQPFNYYSTQVKIRDHTRNISSLLIQNYEKMMNVDFEQYFESAIEECSYNISDTEFNEFFIKSSLAAFADNPSQAPWFKAPIVYHLNLDLITDHYGGNEELTKAAALRDVENIHPATSTLEQLYAFREKIRSFYEKYYGPAGELTIVHGNYRDSASDGMLTFGAHSIQEDSNYIAGYAATIRNIPNPVNIDYLGYSSMTGDVVTVNLDELDEVT